VLAELALMHRIYRLPDWQGVKTLTRYDTAFTAQAGTEENPAQNAHLLFKNCAFSPHFALSRVRLRLFSDGVKATGNFTGTE